MSSFHSKVKDQLSLVTANVTASIINGIFWLYLASLLEKGEYGEVVYWISMAEVGWALSNLGLGGLVTVYGAKGEKVLGPAYEVGLISSFILAGAMYFLVANIAVSFLIVGTMIWVLFQAELNSKKRYTVWSKYHVLRKVIMVIAALLLYQVFGINGLVWGFFVSLLPAFIGVYKFIKSEKISVSVLRSKFQFMLNYHFSVLTTHLFWWGDKVIVGSLFSLPTLGSYQVAAQFVGLLYTIPVAIGTYLLPQESQRIKNKKMKILSVGLVSILVLVVIVSAPYIVDVFFKSYSDSILAIQIMIIGIIPITISTIFESTFLGQEKSRYVLYGGALHTASFFVLLVYLGNDVGLTGIALSFLLSSLIKSVYDSLIMTRLKFE